MSDISVKERGSVLLLFIKKIMNCKKSLNQSDVWKFLEDVLRKNENQIKVLNKHYNEGNSFLINTSRIIQISINDEETYYLVIVFEDLPRSYSSRLLENIKAYMEERDLQSEYVSWSSFDRYFNLRML